MFPFNKKTYEFRSMIHSLGEHPASEMPEAFNRPLLWCSLACVAFMTPFSINNFVQGRYAIGVGSVVIVCIFAFNSWCLTKRGRYYPDLMLYGLLPMVILFLVMCIQTQGVIGAFWCYPAATAFYFMLPEQKARMANLCILAAALPVVFLSLDPALSPRIAATLGIVSLFSALCINVINRQQRSLALQAVTDSLTGVFNRALLVQTLDEAIALDRDGGVPMTLVTFDLDHFKAINDTHGHDAGDRVLVEFAAVLMNRTRQGDRVFRLGGEEFLVLLPEAESRATLGFAEDVRRATEALEAIPGHAVTVSIGIAGLRPGENRESWMKRADENLYRAKSDGRNRIAA